MKYRKKPVVIDAIQATKELVLKWLNGIEQYPDKISLGRAHWHKEKNEVYDFVGRVETLKGIMRFEINDWIIVGIKGEMYCCESDIFEKTYEPIKE